MNRKQTVFLLIGIVGMLFVAWECFNFPFTDCSEIETTRWRLFWYFEIMIALSTAWLVYRYRDKRLKNEQKQ